MSEPAVWPGVRPATLAGLLRARAAERPEHTAFTFLADGEVEVARLTYEELDRRARAIALALREGLEPGDRALLLYPPGLELIAAFFGCLYAGVVAVPAYPPRRNDRSQTRLRAMARDAGPRAALTTSSLFTAAVDGDGFASRVPELAAVRWIPTDVLEGSGAELPEPDPEAVAFLQYTSGSTATPKGVMITQANLLHNEEMIGKAFRQDEDSVVVGWLPLYHDMGLIGNVLQPIHAGGRCVLMAPAAFLQKPLRWLEAIHRYRGTTSGGPNFAYELCVRKIAPEQREGLDLSSWRVAFNGAEPVRAETLERFASAFAPCGFRREAFYPCYGLAEATLFVTGGEPGRWPRIEAVDAEALERHEVAPHPPVPPLPSPPTLPGEGGRGCFGTEGREVELFSPLPAGREGMGEGPGVRGSATRRLVSCGHAWKGQRIAVVDPETGAELAPGRVGEVWISGPSVSCGYWRNPEATERDFRARLATGEGPFLRTGDLGFLLGGELYVTGRLKDLIIIRGRNHYPQDVELTAERSHPDLRPGCGAAFPVDAAGEERLVVVQEVERRRRDGLEEVAEAVRRAVAEEHDVQVHEVVLVRVGTVPKTSSGKIQRRLCRKQYLRGELSVVGRSAVAEAPVPAGPTVVPTRGALAALEPAERRTVVERFLRERAAAAVGVAPSAIDPQRPLTGLGLDSLGAVELKAGVEAALGVPLPLADLLEGAGTGEIAELLLVAIEGAGLRDRTAGGAPTRLRGGLQCPPRHSDSCAPSSSDPAALLPALRPGAAEAGDQPLSYGQKALWFLHRLAPEGGAYNIAVAARTRSGLDVAALRRAFAALAARHAALRSVFPVKGEEPVRRVLEGPEIDFGVEDAAVWSEARLAERLGEEAYRPFDLDHGPVMRVRVFDRGAGEHVLLLAVHHIAADFWSFAVAARDLAALYARETGGPAGAELPPLPVSYGDYVRWQDEALSGPRGERLWDYWRAALAGVPDLDLPTDRPRPPVQTWRGGARTLELPPDLADGVRALAAAHGATVFMVLLAAFQAQLGRYAGQDDLAVGSPTFGRGLPELALLMGYCVNPVALRADLAGDPSFVGLLGRARRRTLEGLEHGDYPFALLAERLRPVRDPSRTPVFQTLFLLQRPRPGDEPGLATFALGESGGRLALGGLELESLRLEERRAQLDLTLRMAEEAGGRLRASLEHNADLFDGETAERMLGHFRTLLEGAVADPVRPLSRLPLLTPAERWQLLVDWNATAAGHPADLPLHRVFEAQAARTPRAEALVAGEDRLTYEELSRRANRLARHLQSLGVGPEVRVGVQLGRNAGLVVSLLAVLKAGGAYVPLDPKYPRERLELMVADSGARVVIGEDLLARDRAVIDAYDDADLRAAALPGNLAYLIYTSGSTGRPKAVAIEHRSAAALVHWARTLFSPEELAGVLASTSTAFDLSVFEIFVPLCWGGRVILAENALELPRLAAAGEVTLVNTVPSAMAELVRSGGVPPSVRTVNLAGEPLPPGLVDAVHEVPGVERLYNLYGPSEDTTYSTFAPLAAGRPVTIGRPLDDTRAYVVDAAFEPLPVGVPGELVLGGAGLARGYLGRPELTAERFVPDPFGAEGGNGTPGPEQATGSAPGARLYRTGDLVRRRPDSDLDFLGRIDHQVKIRGFRIELGEIEAALARHPAVREAAVLALPERSGDGRRLAAYVAPEDGERAGMLRTAELRTFLKDRLPDAFVPAAWAVLPALPLSPNGKVDRRALAGIEPRIEPEAEGGPAAEEGVGEPRSPIEEALAGIMAEILGLQRVGIHDDFFALGGHSLLAARLLSRVSRAFAVDLPVSAVFQAPTVAALAGKLSAAAAAGTAGAPPVRPVLRPHEGRADLPLSFAQQRLWFLDQLQPGGAAYNMPGAVLLEGPLSVPALATGLAALVRRHEALRTRLAHHGGRPAQVVDPAPATVPLPVADLSGLPEPVRDAAAGGLMREEAARPFDLQRGPLLRAGLVRLGAERHLLLLTLHHIVADGWSMGVLMGDLAALYEAGRGGEGRARTERNCLNGEAGTEARVGGEFEHCPQPAPRPHGLPELPVQYADYAVWQREWLSGGVLAAQLAWWKERLAGAPTTLELPADRPRPSFRTQRGFQLPTRLPADLAGGLRDLARRQGATLFMGLLAVFETLLLRLTGQEDLLVGSAVANRSRHEVEGLIGLFANTLVLRAELAGDPPFAEALAQARESTLGAFVRQDLPVEKLVEELLPGRELGQTPLFQVLIVLQNAPVPLELPGLLLRRVPVETETAKLDLTLELAEGGEGLAAVWELSRDLFDPETGRRMAGWFETLVRGAVADPGRRLSDLPLLGEEERRQLLMNGNPDVNPASTWNPGTAPPGVPIHRLFEEQAAREPGRIAVVASDGLELTYGELNARANRLARHLRKLGVRPEALVGVSVERSVEMVEAFLAVSKAGGAYVPLDPSWPRERRAELIGEAGLGLVLTAESWPGREAIEAEDPSDLPGPDAGGLAYAMFTSGSTGRPKTVGVEHRGIVRLVRGADWADLGPEQVFLQLAPPAFDAATLEVWGALANGGRLALCAPGAPSLDELGEALARHGVTTLWLTAGLFHQVVESRIGILAGLRQLLAGGDVLAPEAVGRVLAELPGCRLINGYGPTENTTFTCCHTVREPVPAGRSVPIGRPVAGTRVYVLDRHLQPVPAGVPGELFAGGAGLARGYLGRPDLTAERFVPSPFSGMNDEPGARLYRTGDLVRWRHELAAGDRPALRRSFVCAPAALPVACSGRTVPGPDLEFLERIDRQVKIRGFRVEPGEIEAVLSRHPGVAQAAVLVRGEGAGRRLAACVVSARGDLSLVELRAWLAERLPSYLIPSLAAVPALPLSPNGKVDRAALALLAPEPETATRSGDAPPRDPVEELLAGIWAEVLGLERVGIHDDFFALGGHSLLATRAVSRIVETLRVELPLARFFEAPTVAALAAKLSGARPAAELPPVFPVPRGEPLPLSFAQQRLWFLDRLAPGGAAYNLAAAALLEGDLDAAALERSLDEIVRRHEALRTVFAEIGGRPVQVVRPPGPVRLARLDLSGLPEAGRLPRAREAAAAEAARPFDLATGPVVRFLLVRLAGREHLLVGTFHHIAADGWSLQVFLGELSALYGAFAAGLPSPLPDLPVQYADYAVWQRRTLTGAVLARSLAFWRRRLAGAAPLDLPGDAPGDPGGAEPSGPARAARAARTIRLDLPPAMAETAAGRAREAGVTPFMVLLAGFYALLARLTGETDLVLGAPVAARDRNEVEGLIGFFANTLPLRADLGGDPGFRELLARVRATVLEAHRHAEVPFERLVEELQPERAAGRNPFFDVLLAYMSAPPAGLAIPGLDLTPVDVPGAEAKLGLTWTVHEREGGFAGTLEARAGLFGEAALARLAERLRSLLAAALAEPSARLSGLPLLSAAERLQVLEEWSRSAPAAAPDGCFHELFAAQARRTPDAPAVVCGERALTYGELELLANRLAHHLLALGAGPETLTAVLLDRSPDMIVAVLAALGTGGAYLPLDPSQPGERTASVLADAGAALLVTRSGLAPAGEAVGPRAVCLDLEAADIAARPGTSPLVPAVPESLAYVIYTSGSTGRPKGVAVSHRAVVSFAAAMRQAVPELRSGLGPPLRRGFNAPLAFDASVQQLAGLLDGHALHIVPDEARLDAARLAAFLRDAALDGFDCTPGQLEIVLAAAADSGRPPRFVLSGGEAIPVALWERLAAHPDIRSYNVYGPTEAAVNAAWCPVAEGRPSLGRPLPGYRIHVLDAGMQPLPPGARGEIWIGGPGLARGYWRSSALTAERFLPDPFSADPGERLYRTGDLGRWLRDGRIESLGRVDRQVKVRGFRVEPGEIETCLRRHPEVRDAAVVARRDAAGTVRLVACFVSWAPVQASSLRDHLRQSLPEHMVPARFHRLDALPLTPAGKLDYRALERLDPPAEGEAGGGAPRTPAQELLAGIWCELLGVPGGGRIGADDSFFDLGGHSLLATRLAARVRSVFGVEVPLSELFAAPTLGGMAERVEEARRAAEGDAMPPLARRSRPEADAELSFAQQRLWFLHQLEPESAAYHVSGALRLTGPLRPGALAGALGEIVRRHEALRTVFVTTEAGPVQRALPQAGLALPLVDLGSVPGSVPGAEAEAERLGLAEARRTFDLRTGPLLRAVLVRLAREEHLLVVVMHHIVSDGWSLGVMMGELAALYAAFAAGGPSPLPELALQYADFAEWQRRTLQGPALEGPLAWWRAQLADPPVLDLPADHPRPPVPSGRGGWLPTALPAGLSRGLAGLARGEGATLFMVLLAGLSALLHRYSGQDHLTVGSPIAGRDRQEIEPLIGCFVNTLPLRVRLAGDPTVRELLARVREVTLGAYDHQRVPFEKLVEELAPERDRARSPLFQVLLVLQNAPQPALRMGDLTFSRSELPTGTAKFDLTLALAEEGEGIAGAVEYSADLFEAATALRLLGHLAELLSGAVDDPGRRISGLPLLTASERAQLLAGGEVSARAAGDRPRRPRRLDELVAAQAARTPDAPAVVGWQDGREVRLSYADLLVRADRLAARLVDLGAGPEARVGVCLERTPDLPAALLGILRSGAAYVPLDPDLPAERLAFLLADSGVSVLLTHPGLEPRLPETPGLARLLLDTGSESLAAGRPGPLREGAAGPGDPGSAAYVIYTSGSTGRPKGVVVTHGNVARLLSATQGWFGFGPADVWTLFHSYAFDFSVWEIWGALAHGGRLVVVPYWVSRSPEAFLDLLESERVTVLNQTPSAFRQLAAAEAERPRRLALRTVVFGGEALDPAGLASWFDRHGDREPLLVNMYGITETTVHVTYRPLSRADLGAGSRIGVPIPDLRAHVLDRHFELVPLLVPGEIHVGGAGLARGYLHRPELTAERFVPDPFSPGPGARLYRSGDLARRRPDGELEYLGRIDNQVKIRGFRIELGEIEAALARHPEVSEGVVLARDDASGGKALVACVVPREGAGLSPSGLRSFLRRSLPEHMVPSAFVELAALPLNANGKVDRRALSRLRLEAEPSAGTAAPRTPTEELLAALWSEVLGRERVGVHDSFFELGGHSLLATRLISRVRATLGCELPLARLFDAPTVAELARLVDEARTGGAASTAPVRPAPRDACGGSLPLSFAQERLWFLDRMQPGALYSVPLAVRLRGPLDPAALGAAFGAVVARHEALRTVFPEDDGEPVQRVLPPAAPAAWPLPLVDLDGLRNPEAEGTVLAARDALLPFVLPEGPLLRTTLVRLGAREHLLLVAMHHIVSDGWSLGVLLAELAELYGAAVFAEEPALLDLPVQYADYAVWQREQLRGEELERQVDFWRRQLAGAPAVLDLPTDRPRPLLQTSNGASRPVLLPAGLTARLAALGRREGLTPFMLLLSAWAALLHRHSGQSDLNVGIPIAGRNRSEIEPLIGFFVNTLVLRADLSGDPAFADFAGCMRQVALAAYDHQDLPFEKLVDELKPVRDMSRQPLFQVMFALQNAPLGKMALPGGLALEPVESASAVAKFDLTLNLREAGDGILGLLEHNTDLFDATTAARLAAHFEVLLAAVADDPARPVSALPVLTVGELQQLLVEWTDADTRPLGPCLHEVFERQVERDPDALAVVFQDVQWSYGELNRRANQLAWYLRSHLGIEVGLEARIGLCVEKSADMLVGMLGALKAGAAYVPLDPAYPQDRLAFMLEDTRAPVVLTQQRLVERLPRTSARLVCLDADWDEIARSPRHAPESGVTGQTPAYVIYTSGSTGAPKGVVVTHDSVVAYSQASSAVYGMRPGDRYLQFSSISFDASVEEIYGCLTRGATLVVSGDVQEGISQFLERCRAQGITQLQFPTAFWHQLATAMEGEGLELPPLVRVMFIGGERMLAQRLVSWWKLVPPGFQLINAYGPTETTVAATLCRFPGTVPLDDSLREVPLGRPLRYVRAYVLDRDLRPVPLGVTGELCLGGLGLARGYLDRPELTAERFIPNPYVDLWGRPGERLYRTGDLVRLLPAGLLELVGRADHQVKIRGYRIELGEIEAALAEHPGVGEAVVLAREDIPGDLRLAGYVSSKGEPAPTVAELRKYLEDRLPSYMVPALLHVLPALPISAQGKVDRRALASLAPDLRRERRVYAAPRNEMERTIAAVWRETFELEDPESIGVDDNFFDSGGNSLLLVKLHSRLQKALGRSFPLVELFKHPTIRALAASLEAERPAAPSLDKARARTDARRESLRQMQQLREQRRTQKRNPR